MGTSDVDDWELAGFPGRLDVAAYLAADQHAAQYRVLVDVLLDAQEQSLTGVSREESASPATGSLTLHQQEQRKLVDRVLRGL